MPTSIYDTKWAEPYKHSGFEKNGYWYFVWYIGKKYNMTHSVECLEWHRNQNMHIQFCFNNVETDNNLYGYASVCHQIVIVKKKRIWNLFVLNFSHTIQITCNCSCTESTGRMKLGQQLSLRWRNNTAFHKFSVDFYYLGNTGCIITKLAKRLSELSDVKVCRRDKQGSFYLSFVCL